MAKLNLLTLYMSSKDAYKDIHDAKILVLFKLIIKTAQIGFRAHRALGRRTRHERCGRLCPYLRGGRSPR